MLAVAGLSQVLGVEPSQAGSLIQQLASFYIRSYMDEAFIGVLGIQDICHFTSRDIGYYPFYFQGYGILGSILSLLPGILKN